MSDTFFVEPNDKPQTQVVHVKKRDREGDEELEHLRKDPSLVTSSFADEKKASTYPFTEETFPYLKETIEWLGCSFKCVYCNEIILRKESIGRLDCFHHPYLPIRMEIGKEFGEDGYYHTIYAEKYPCCDGTLDSRGCRSCDHNDTLHTLPTMSVQRYFLEHKHIVGVRTKAVIFTHPVYEKELNEDGTLVNGSSDSDSTTTTSHKKKKFDLFQTYYTIKRC